MNASRKPILGALSAVAFSSLLAACAPSSPAVSADEALQVRRGTLAREVLLTGELRARDAESLSVPPVPEWNVMLKWVADDGREVKAGDPVAELDTTALLGPLRESTTAASTAAHEISKLRSEGHASEIGKALELEMRRVELEKARLDAAVPDEVVAAWERQQRQLALARAAAGREKAEVGLGAAHTAAVADVEVQQLEHHRAMSDISAAERTIASFTLKAPRDGVLILGEHPWFGRKIETGDMLWEGRLIASLPQLETLRVIAALSDVDDGAIAPGQRAEVVLDSFPDRRYGGRVASVSDVAQESAKSSARRSFEVVVELEAVDVERMLPGQSVKVLVHGEELADRLLVPRAALSFAGATPRLFTLDGPVAVELGPCSSQACVLVAPELAAGTRLLLDRREGEGS